MEVPAWELGFGVGQHAVDQALDVDVGDLVGWVVGLFRDLELLQDVFDQECEVLATFNFDKRAADVVLAQELEHVLQLGEVSGMHIVHFRGEAHGSVFAEPDVDAEVHHNFGVAGVNVFMSEIEPHVAGSAAVRVVAEAHVFVGCGVCSS